MYSEFRLDQSAVEVAASEDRRRSLPIKVGRIILLVFAAIVSIWAVVDPSFRDADGFPKGQICLPISATIGLAAFAWGLVTPWRKFVFWFSASLVGQAVALQLIDAGNFIRYQHYRPSSWLIAHPVLLVLLAAQTLLVAGNIIRHGLEIRVWLKEHFRLWQLFVVAVVFFLSSAALSRDVSFYVKEVFFAAFVQTVNLGSILLMALAIPDGVTPKLKVRIEKMLGPGGGEEAVAGRIDKFAVLAAGWVLLLATVLSLYSYERHPHVPDEVIYLTHARYLATGNLSLTVPPVHDAFDLYLMDQKGDRWFAVPPPGWPVVLAIGVKLGAPWLVNPLLAALCVLLMYVLVCELYNRRTARWVILLLCASPWFVFMAMNFMTHTLTLVCALGAWLGVNWARRTGNARWAWAAGVLVGLASLIRPLEGLLVAALLGLWSLGIGGRRLKVPSILAFILASVLVGGIVLPYNALLTGDPKVFPLMAYLDKHFGPNSNALGFGPDRGIGWQLQPFRGHSPLGALVNSNLNVFSLNIELLGWSFGSLLLVSLFLISGKKSRNDYLMLAVIIAIYGVHFFYWYSGGPDFGARYWYLMLIPLLVLTARGIDLLERRLGDKSETSEKSLRVALIVFALSAMAVINYFPWRAIDKYHNYLNMRPDIRYLAGQHNFGRSLVLIRGENHPDYASAAIYNPLDLHADLPIYAWDHNREMRNEVLKAYVDRPVWLIDGPSLTHSGFKVVAGPLSAQELLVAAP